MTITQPVMCDEVEPPVITNVSKVSVDRVWHFLEESGFIYPQKRQTINFDAAKSTLEKLRTENEVFKGLVVTRGSTIYAHLSAVKVYDNVWMVQHMASRPYKREKVSHALMLNLALLEYFEQNSDIKWIRATYRHENKRVSRLYESMAAQVANPELSITKYLNCMRLANLPPEVSNPECQVRWEPDGIPTLDGDTCSNELSRAYAKIGLERRQGHLGVYRSDRLVGYSVLDISPPGLNLSELTNAFRVSMLGTDVAALSMLIQGSANYYRSLGHQHVTALVEDDLVPNLEALGFDQFKRYTFWTWHQSLCRQFHDYISKWAG